MTRGREEALEASPRVERLIEVQRAREAMEAGDADAMRASIEELIDKTARFQDIWLETTDRVRELYEKPYMDEINRLRGLLATDSPERMLAALAVHFKEPVRPVSEYCGAFYDWHRALVERGKEGDAYAGQYAEIANHLAALQIPIAKSNYLWRRLYGGEPHRTEECPVHKGHWSGCVWGERECPHCMSGSNVTGWLPAEASA